MKCSENFFTSLKKNAHVGGDHVGGCQETADVTRFKDYTDSSSSPSITAAAKRQQFENSCFFEDSISNISSVINTWLFIDEDLGYIGIFWSTKYFV